MTDDANDTPAAPLPMRWRTVPNLVSLLRLVVFIPLTIWLIAQPDQQLLATVSLVLFGATDWIDGFLARRLNQASRVGEVLDPIADRIGVIAIAIALTLTGIMPAYIVLVIAITDLALGIIGLLRLERVRDGHVLGIGKVRTALIMVGMPLILLSAAPEVATEPMRTIALVVLAIGTGLHLLTTVLYGYRYLAPTHAPGVARLDRGSQLFASRKRR